MKHLLLKIVLIYLIFSNESTLVEPFCFSACKFLLCNMYYIFSILYTVVEMLWDFRKLYIYTIVCMFSLYECIFTFQMNTSKD